MNKLIKNNMTKMLFLMIALLLACSSDNVTLSQNNPFDKDSPNYIPPVISAMDDTTIQVFDNISLHTGASVYYGGIKQYYWYDSNNILLDSTIDSIFTKTFDSAGIYKIIVDARDSIGLCADVPDTIRVTVNKNESTLINPTNNAQITPDTVDFIWSKGVYCDSFSLILDTISNPTKVVASSVLDTFVSIYNLELFKTYYWSVRSYNSQGQSVNSAVDSFSTIVSLDPILSINDTTITVSCLSTDSAFTDTMIITNIGNSNLDYSVSESATWLEITPLNGSLPSYNDNDTIVLTFNPAGLSDSLYIESVEVSGPLGQKINIKVEMNVADPSIGTDVTSTILKEARQDSNAISDTFNIFNEGGGTLNFTISDNVTWLECSPSNETSTGVKDSQEIIITYETSTLPVAIHNATIMITSPGLATKSFDISLDLLPRPQPEVSSTSIINYCEQGMNATTDSFYVWNSGSGTLNFNITDSNDCDSIDWITIIPSSNNSTGSNDKKLIKVIYNTSELFPAPHFGSISVVGQGNATIENINVSMSIRQKWTNVTEQASFTVRSYHSSEIFNNKLWVIGGGNGSLGFEGYLNDVWCSEDGNTWTEVTSNAAFSQRRSHTSVVFDDKLWVIGGYNRYGSSSIESDIWYSSDGVSWIEAANNSAASGRYGHTSVVFDNKIWIIAGNSNNDIWNSSDGISWAEVADSVAFPKRSFHSTVVFDNKLWVIGGYDGYNRLNDVWYSSDGISWVEATNSAAFLPRFGHSSLVFDNKIWTIGGANKNDVWYSSDGITWIEATNNAGFSERYGLTSTVFNGKLWMIGGSTGDGGHKNDIWYSELP